MSDCVITPVAGGFAIGTATGVAKTPKGHDIIVLTHALATVVADELAVMARAVKDKTKNSSPPAMLPFVATVLDLITPDICATVERIAAYAETDLLCYRAVEPPALVARQVDLWQPLLDWAGEVFDFTLTPTTGLMPVAQSADGLTRVRAVLSHLDAWHLMGVQQATEVTGSLILALALMHGRVDAAEVVALAELDSAFQRDQWGDDPVTLARLEKMQADCADCARWFTLLDTPAG